jgi:membrane protease YdiL (CAAX protease family)
MEAPQPLDPGSSPPQDVATSAPPVWPSLLAPLTAIVGTLLVSGTSLLLVALASDPTLRRGDLQANLLEWIEANAGSFPAIVAVIVPAQLTILAVAILFAIIERERILPRLGFVRGSASLSTIALAVVGTLGVQFLIEIVADALIDEPSDSLKLIAKMLSEPQGLAAIGAGFLVSVPPGLCEETLFRGFVQKGLLRRWSPAAAIGTASVFFALAHWDAQHSLAVLPLGAWFGYVAWRTGSVLPAVLCHFANNLFAFVVVRAWGVPGSLESPSGPWATSVGVGLVAVLVLAVLRLRQTSLPER